MTSIVSNIFCEILIHRVNDYATSLAELSSSGQNYLLFISIISVTIRLSNDHVIFGPSPRTSARYPASILLFPVSLWTIVSDCLRYGRDGRKVQNNLRK